MCESYVFLDFWKTRTYIGNFSVTSCNLQRPYVLSCGPFNNRGSEENLTVTKLNKENP